MLIRKCDLCGKEVGPRYVSGGYVLPLGKAQATEFGIVVKDRFHGLAAMDTDLCKECADKIHELCINIAEGR